MRRARRSAQLLTALAGKLALSCLLLPACGADPGTARPARLTVAVGSAVPVVQVAGEGPERPREPPGMVYVPPGAFLRGCSPRDDRCYAIEQPAARVHLDGFFIDRVEVTVAAYQTCVEDGACTIEGLDLHTSEHSTQNAPTTGVNTTQFGEAAESETCNWVGRAGERREHPINCASWHQASAYCAWARKRLPTEAEWEKAARGNGEHVYPWGDAAPTCALAVMTERGLGCDAGHTAPVGSRPRGRSPYGLLDMSGNVSEWVADWYAEDYYASSPPENPPGPPGGRFRVTRGGSFRVQITGKVDALRVSNRYSYVPGAHLDFVGFRCARDAR